MTAAAVRGAETKKKKMDAQRKFPYVVFPWVIVPLRAAAQKGTKGNKKKNMKKEQKIGD